MGFRYVGGGSFHHGIPARNLSQADYEALADDQRKVVREGGLYRREKDETLFPQESDVAEAAPAPEADASDKEGD